MYINRCDLEIESSTDCGFELKGFLSFHLSANIKSLLHRKRQKPQHHLRDVGVFEL
jgi:hypothetical protein